MADDADALAPRDLPPRAPPPSDPLAADYRQNVQDIRGSLEKERGIAAERNAALAGPRQQMTEMTRQPLPQPPMPREAPPVPGRTSAADDEAWLAVAGVLGAIAGGLTRNHATNAIAAMTGAMQGYTEGSQQKFDQEMKRWDAENKKMLESNQAANDRYTQILQSNKLALEQKSMELQMIAAQYDDRAAMQLAQTKQFETLGRLIEQRMQHQEQQQARAATIEEKAREWYQREKIAREANESRIEAARLRATAGGGTVNQDAIDNRVEMFLTGNPNATKGMRAGTPEYQAFSARLAEVAKERGITAEQMAKMQTGYAGETSYQRSAGTMSARVENAVNEVDQLLPQAEDASAKLPRGKFVPYNKLKQMWEAGTSNPSYNDFLMANFALEKAYGRAMNPQGVPRVQEAMEAKADGILSLATSPEAYAVQLRRLKLEVEASKRATQMTRAGTRESTPSPAAGAPAAPAPAKPAGDLLDTVRSKLPPGWKAEPIPTPSFIPGDEGMP